MHLFLREDVIFGIAWNVDGELRAPFLIIERSCEIWLYIERNNEFIQEEYQQSNALKD